MNLRSVRKIGTMLLFAILIQSMIPIVKVKAMSKTKEELLNSMTTTEKIAQMVMPAFREFNGEDVTELNEHLKELIANYGFAGIILFDENNSNTEQTVRLIDSIQTVNIQNKDRPGLLISVDQEGAGITRLADGTQGPGNMALGATGDSSNSYKMGEIIGSELHSIGYNTDFAPDIDVNSNPSNPIIGVRSFSDDAKIVAEYGKQFMKGIKKQKVIPCLKHFPGHGDTDIDSHTGLPRIEKSYDELKRNELIPFENCINNDAEMIMTAHIQYPKIETDTYKSIKDGREIELPATLSKKIVTDILRNDLGYNGVIVTDALNMEAISDNFKKVDSARLAINAGVDILLMPVTVTSEVEIKELEKYISDVADLVDNGEISQENVNKAVLRILTLKENNGLFQEYNNLNLQNKIEEAKNNVGSKENHDKEWEITSKSITLVKNDNMLPIQNNDKTAILVPYDNEVLSGKYAIEKLKQDKIISQDMDISVNSIQEKKIGEIEEIIQNVKNVILITEQYSEEALGGERYENYEYIIDYVHEKGNKIVCISCNLPYDVARLRNADSILVAYSARGMEELPEFQNRPVKSYGVSIPCAIYTAFNTEAELGKLPVNIPKLDNDYKYTKEYSYERNFGLQYKKDNVSLKETTDSKVEKTEIGVSNPGIEIQIVGIVCAIGVVTGICIILTVKNKKRNL